jgi:thiol-disulfide isomerase/thioredoxin
MRSGPWLPTVNRAVQTGLFLAVALIAGIAGFYFNRGSLSSPVVEGAAESLMLASFPDPSGKPQAMSQWRGKVLVVNFWATWCAPCREEIPALMKLQHKYADNGVQFVGIAMDHVPKVRDYANNMKIDYPLLIGAMETLGLAKNLGNRAGVLPFTVVLSRAGRVVYTHVGALTEASLGEVLASLL